MLDDLDALRARDSQDFLPRLRALPGSYDGPDGRQPEPYGLLAFGEAGDLAAVAGGWVDGPVVTQGTQFLFAGGFDFGEAATLRTATELAGARPIVVGDEVYDPAYRVAGEPLSVYTYLGYLAHATGHGQAWRDAEARLADLADRVGPEVPTDLNPAKQLAWALWNRVPLLVSTRAWAPMQGLVQQVFARVGKTLAVPTGTHPGAVVSGAFEGRHQLGDDLVGLVVGPEDDEVGLVREVLATRVAQVERLDGADDAPSTGDRVADALVSWYRAVWTASYLALLHSFDPSENPVYQRVRSAASGTPDPQGGGTPDARA